MIQGQQFFFNCDLTNIAVTRNCYHILDLQCYPQEVICKNYRKLKQ